MQSLVPSYLEYSIQTLTQNQQKFREQVHQAFGGNAFGTAAFAAMEEQAQKNMTMFREALKMFTPFPLQPGTAADGAVAERPAESGELDELRRQLSDVQKRLDKLSG